VWLALGGVNVADRVGVVVAFALELGIPELAMEVDVIVDGATDDDDPLKLGVNVEVTKSVDLLGAGMGLRVTVTLAVPLSWRRTLTSRGSG
jgi:hypothetical protein